MAGRFWKGGGSSTNWSATAPTNWSATSGGANNASVPGSGDDVFFDAASGTPSVLDANITINSLDCTGFVGTLTHNASVMLTIAGNGVVFKLAIGMTYTLGNVSTSALSFTGTSGSTALTFAGRAVGNVDFNGLGGTWQLADAMAQGSGALASLTKGTLDTNGQTCTWGGFSSSQNNVRALTLGSSAITIITSGGWNVTVANLTLTAGTSVITLTGASQSFTDRNGHAYWDIVFNGSGNPGVDMEGGTSCRNLTIGPTAGMGNITFRRNNAAIITGVLTIAGLDEGHRVAVNSGGSGFVGLTATISVGGSFALQYLDIQDIAATGASGTWSGTRLGNAGGNSGITFDATRTLFWVGNSGGWNDTAHWSTTSGGASGALIPLAQDTLRFDANSFTSTGRTVTMNGLTYPGTVDFTGVTNNPTLGNTSNNPTICGSFILSGATLSGTAGLTLGGRSSYVLTTAGNTFAMNVTVDAPGGTLTLQDAWTQTGTLTLNSGTFDTGGFTWTAVSFVVGGSVAKALVLRGSTVTFSAAAAPFNATSAIAGGFTVTPGTSTIVFTNASATAHTITWTGLTFWNIQITGAGTGAWTIVGSATCSDFRVDTPPHTINFTAGITVTVTTFTVNGTPGNPMTLQSTVPGTAWNLVSSAVNIVCDSLSLQDSRTSGGANWNATRSTNVSGNSGWSFAALVLTLVGPQVRASLDPAVIAAARLDTSMSVGARLETDLVLPASLA